MVEKMTAVKIFDSKKEALAEHKNYKYKDIYQFQIRELDEIGYRSDVEPKFVVCPATGTVLKIVDKNSLFALRTNRNQLLINSKEQTSLRGKRIGIVGLSVGLSIALSMAYCGIGSSYSLSDFDELSTTNLNRVQAGLADVGEAKIDILERRIHELDPYIDVTKYQKGLDSKNLTSFMSKPKKLDLVFEEIDDFVMKIKIRIEAKKACIPLVMMTNLGDSILIDIENYKSNSEQPIFNGLIPNNVIDSILNGEINDEDKSKYAVAIVGKENVPARALESLARIGKDLVGRPQLYSTVSASGGVAGYIAKSILLDLGIESGRYKINFEDIYEQ